MLENIVNKFSQKGWNLYEIKESNQNIYDVVPKGKVNTLGRDKKYIVLPCIRNPKDFSEMQSQLEAMERIKESPSLCLGSERIPLIFFLVKEKNILLYYQGRNTFNHEEFYRMLETLTDRIAN